MYLIIAAVTASKEGLIVRKLFKRTRPDFSMSIPKTEIDCPYSYFDNQGN